MHTNLARHAPPRTLPGPPRAPSDTGSIGTAAHAVIRQLACDGQGLARAELEELAARLARGVVAPRPLTGRARSARVMVAGRAIVYARSFLPPLPWRLLATELDLGEDGRVDLVWGDPVAHVLFDEVKTGRLADPFGAGSTRDAAKRYLRAGLERHGASFLGVRVILVAAPRRSALIAPDGRVLPLVSTPYWFAPPAAASDRPGTTSSSNGATR